MSHAASSFCVISQLRGSAHVTCLWAQPGSKGYQDCVVICCTPIQANLPFLTPRKKGLKWDEWPLHPHTQYTFLQARNVQSFSRGGASWPHWVSLIVHPPSCQVSLWPSCWTTCWDLMPPRDEQALNLPSYLYSPRDSHSVQIFALK